ncbi:MAG: amidohydrolase family protein [Chloroflexi bacterium]|nr:amidohydrolase family protein [Chloroflexota bacterium]
MLIRNLRLIDGAGDIRDGVDVLIRGGRFAEIGPGLDGYGEEVDAGGATAIPGLIDAHTHLTLDSTTRAIENAATRPHAEQAGETAGRAAAMLGLGVTTVREVGGVAELSLGLRDRVASGSASGPRIFSAGAWITLPDGHGWQVGLPADDRDSLRRAAHQQLDDGADLLKMMVSGAVLRPDGQPDPQQYSEEEVAIVTSVAHAEGKRVAAHAHGEPSIRNAVRGGIDTVEHASFVTAELIEEMLERGTFIVPTLAVIRLVLAILRGEMLERTAELADRHHAGITAAWRAGVPIAAGTDMGGAPLTGPDTIHAEIEHLTGIGMSNHEAIQAATLQGARAIGVEDDLGTVRPGLRADLLILDGDPLDDIAATRSARHLLQDGEWRIRDGVQVA